MESLLEMRGDTTDAVTEKVFWRRDDQVFKVNRYSALKLLCCGLDFFFCLVCVGFVFVCFSFKSLAALHFVFLEVICKIHEDSFRFRK